MRRNKRGERERMSETKPRDPQWEPKAGDCWHWEGKRLHFSRTVRRVGEDEVYYQDGRGQLCAATMNSWIKWTGKAKCTHAAD